VYSRDPFLPSPITWNTNLPFVQQRQENRSYKRQRHEYKAQQRGDVIGSIGENTDDDEDSDDDEDDQHHHRPVRKEAGRHAGGNLAPPAWSSTHRRGWRLGKKQLDKK
jgi:hypothetical protein